MNWQPEHDDKLRTLWGDGETATTIASRLGMGLTRNAVLGRLHRLHLLGKRVRISRPSAPRPELTREQKAAAQEAARQTRALAAGRLKTTVRKVEISEAEQQARTEVAVAMGRAEPVFTPSQFTVRESAAVRLEKTLQELGPRDCHWPNGVGDPNHAVGMPITFCGQPQAPGKSYCQSCCDVAFYTPKSLDEQERARRSATARKNRGAPLGDGYHTDVRTLDDAA